MSFSNNKKNILSKEDKSQKGCIDDAIQSLCNALNAMDNYCTTSSCSGRIVLIQQSVSGKKNESTWLVNSHDVLTRDIVAQALQYLPQDPIWFRFEGFILHVCCKTIDNAQYLIQAARDAGCKRAGIISMSEKIMVELIDTERIDCPISGNGKLLVSEEYVGYLVHLSNGKLGKTREKIRRLENAIKKLYSDVMKKEK